MEGRARCKHPMGELAGSSVIGFAIIDIIIIVVILIPTLYNGRGSIPGGGWEFFSSTPCPDRLWDSPSLLPNGYQGFFPGSKAAGA